jgi:hypothetical protein
MPPDRSTARGCCVSAYDALRRVLSDRPIAFHPALARVLGGINEALLFQQIAYWSDKGADPEWIYKTQADIEAETTLARTQQENARRKLRALGVIEEQKRGVPARLYYRVNWGAIFALLESSQDAGFLQSRMQVPRGLDSEKPAGKDAGFSHAITESTQRVPTESVEASTGLLRIVDNADEARQALLPFAQDLARELNDQAPLSSTVTRLTNIFHASGLDLDRFLDLLIQARAITQQHTSTIRTPRPDGIGPRPKAAYWFAVLEDLIGQAQASTGTGSD